MSCPALLAAVAADPDADLPRLLYADWLDDHGEADRAEFVRLQVHTAGTGPTDPGWLPAKLSEYELFDRHLAEWPDEKGERGNPSGRAVGASLRALALRRIAHSSTPADLSERWASVELAGVSTN